MNEEKKLFKELYHENEKLLNEKEEQMNLVDKYLQKIDK